MAIFGSVVFEGPDQTTWPEVCSCIVKYSDDYLIVGEHNYINIYDISTPSAVSIHGAYGTSLETGWDFLVDENDADVFYAKRQLGDAVFSMDISDPSKISLRDWVTPLSSFGGPNSFCQIGNYLYFTGCRDTFGDWEVIHIVNVSDPDNLVDEGFFKDQVNIQASSATGGATAFGNYLLISDVNNLLIYDCSSTPTSPTFVAKVAHSKGGLCDKFHIDEDEEYAYTHWYGFGIGIFDISTISSPTFEATVTDATYITNCYRIQVYGDFLFNSVRDVVNGDYYVSVWDIHDRTSPSWLEAFDYNADLAGAWVGVRQGWLIDPDDGQTLHIGRFEWTADYGYALVGVSLPTDGLFIEVDGTEIQIDALGLSIERGRDDELADTATGVAIITVDNEDGDFSPENTGGAWYGVVDMGKPVYIYEVFLGTTYDMFTGRIDKIIPKDSPYAEDRTADIVTGDGMDDMAQRKISLAKITDFTVDELIDDALDEVGWPAGDRNLDTGVDTFEQGWAHNEFALAFILDVARQDGGFFYIDVDGTATFENRHHRITGAHLTPQHDFGTSIRLVDSELSKRFLYNYARVTGKTYNADAENSLLWYAKTGNDDEAPSIGPGETLTLIAEMTLALDSYLTLVEGTHWNANSKSDGTGDDLGANISLVETQRGQEVELAFTNSGSVRAYLVTPGTPPEGEVDKTALVYGKLLQEATITIVREDTDSQDDYGERSFEYTAKFQSRPAQVVAYADFIITRFSNIVPYPVSFTVKAEQNDTIHEWCLKLKLSDRITIASTRLGFDQDYYINKIVHNYDIRGAIYSHSVTFFLERTAGSAEGIAWLLGVTDFGELGEATYLVW